jgi:uridine kinase
MMKANVEALLFSVDRDSKEWIIAKKLLKFLDFSLGYHDKTVPNNSILREFLGGSCFNVG